MKAFDYVRPDSLDDACRLVAQAGGQARFLAGGTDLLVRIKNRILLPHTLVSLRDVPDLVGIDFDDRKGLTLGATTTIGAIGAHAAVRQHYPAIAEAVATIGSMQVRNRATVGGNICNAAPSADMVPILMAYAAELTIRSGDTDTRMALADFFKGPGETVLATGDLVTRIHVPPPPPSSFGTYLKAHRTCLDCAVVGVALVAVVDPATERLQTAKMVLAAVAPTPLRTPKTEALLKDQALTDELIEQAGRMAAEESRPITDVRSTASYRRTLVAVTARRALVKARDWARKGV